MKIIIQQGMGANYFIRSSWVNNFRLAGHTVIYWNSDDKSPFDLFQENPDCQIFIGSTWQLTRPLVKNLCRYPIKVLLCGDMWLKKDSDLQIDFNKYPVGLATDEQKKMAEEIARINPLFTTIITQHNDAELTHGGWKNIGLKIESVLVSADTTEYFPVNSNESFKNDMVYVGGYWSYKAQSTLDKYLLPLFYPHTSWKIKVFGNGWSCPHFVGKASSDTIREFYRNAIFVPGFGEMHSYDLYGDISLRFFQVPASLGFQIVPRLIDIDKIFSPEEIVLTGSVEEYRERILHYLNNQEETIPFRKNSCLKVFREHTGLHRCAQLMRILQEDCSAIEAIYQEQHKRVETIIEDNRLFP